MTIKNKQRHTGFSLVEMLTTIAILGILVAIVLPHFGGVNSQAEDIKNKRNAQTIVLAYSTGDAAGVRWTTGNVAAKVTAVLAGQYPPSGVFKTNKFQAQITPADAPGTYKYISMNAEGDLFVDPIGGQNASGL